MPVEHAAVGLGQIAARRGPNDEARDYYHGRHPIMFASPKFRRFYESVMRRYRLNLCRPVVRQAASRLDITGWDDPKMAEWWNEYGKRIQNRHFREAIRQGDAFTLTWPRETMTGDLLVNRLRADEATVVYSPEHADTPAYGVKMWQTDSEKVRVNVYWTDHVERFITRHKFDTGSLADIDTSELEPYTEDGADAELRYEGSIAAAGIRGILPLQHWVWQPDETPFGTGILTDGIPVQDALNKHAIDILVSSEQYGLPLRAILGFEVVEETHVGDDGQTYTTDNIPDYDPRIDYALTLPGENSKLIQLPEADLTKILEVKRAAVSDMTMATSVPLSPVTEDSGNVPTGVAMRYIERPLTSLVVDGQQDMSVSAYNLAATLGYDSRPEWADPVQLDVSEQWELVQAKVDAGWPAREAYIEAGMDPDRVDAVLADAQDRESTVGGALVRAEREGRDPAELLR